MESFYLALSTVFPLVAYMVVGQYIKHFKILKPETVKEVNGMIFKVLLPISLFNDIRKADFSHVDKPWAFLYVVTVVVLTYIIAWKSVSAIIKDNRDSSVLIQGIYRSNHVLFGTMVAKNLCTPEGFPIAASMVAIIVPLYNALVVILFELKIKGKVRIKELIKNIFKNPLIQSSVAGFIVKLLGNPIPELANIPIERMAASATPVALIVLGAMLSAEGLRNHRKYISVITLLRLVVVPAIAIGVGVILGLRGDYVVILIAVFASPIATASVATAQTMGGNGELAAELVAVTTVFSVVTIFMMVLLLSNTGII